MEIKLLNKKTFFIKGKKEMVLVNPEIEDKEKSPSRVIVFTNEDLGGHDLEGDKVLINGPGEYEVNGVEVNGVNGEDGNTVYKIGIDGFRLVIMGDLKQELTDKRIEKIDEADILIAPTIIGETPSFKLIKEWSKKWGVNYLIPISEREVDMKAFLDASDNEGLEEIDSLKIEKLDDLPDGLEVKLLKNWNK
ncbi:MAG: MBL fold metallo-hydrolase [Candidatus Shapirobacteria bacterium]|nr:MBL fold metallo-hydrolase [Candidatus Shapirobacteria bacterium]